MCVIYHNPKCSKSRATKQILIDKNIDFTEIDYLNNPPTEQELIDILTNLNLNAKNFIRQGESVFKELNLKNANEDDLIKAMFSNPILIEHPIVITKKGARISRPSENILEIL